ncbi:MAG: hypothetical protein IKG21_06135 [Atopobiaceae bacterium]|nr:hypothetical protein [Atopobiaceae bacterium]
MWPELFGAMAVAFALLYVPGYPFFRGLGLSRTLAACCAPLFSVFVYAALPIAYYDFGIPCGPATLVLPAMVLAMITFGTGHLVRGFFAGKPLLLSSRFGAKLADPPAHRARPDHRHDASARHAEPAESRADDAEPAGFRPGGNFEPVESRPVGGSNSETSRPGYRFAPLPQRPILSMPFDVAIPLLFVFVSTAVCALVFWRVLPAPDALMPRFDNQTHINLTRAFIDSGKWSSLHTSTYLASPPNMRAIPGDGSFYPAAWSCVVALTCITSGVNLLTCVNAVVSLVAIVMFPLNVYAFLRALLGDRRRAIILGVIASTGFAHWPWTYIFTGPLFPNQMGIALQMSALALFVLLVWRARPLQDVAVVAGALPVAFGALALAHPSTVFSAYVFAAFFVGHELQTKAPALLARLHALAWPDVMLPAWLGARPLADVQALRPDPATSDDVRASRPYSATPADERAYQSDATPSQSHLQSAWLDTSPSFEKRVIRWLEQHPRAQAPALLVPYAVLVVGFWVACYSLPMLQGVIGYVEREHSPAVAIALDLFGMRYEIPLVQTGMVVASALGCVFVARHREWRWLLLPVAFFAVGYMAVRTDVWIVKHWIAGLWYSDRRRMAGNLALYLMPIVTLGLDALLPAGRAAIEASSRKRSPVSRLASFLSAKLLSAKHFGVVRIAALIIIVAMVYMPYVPIPGTYGHVWTPLSVASYKIDTRIRRPVYPSEEMAFVDLALSQIPEGALVINAPNDGSVYAYGCNGMNTLFRDIGLTGRTRSADIIRTRLNEFATNEMVHEAVQETGAQYVLQLDRHVPFAEGTWLWQYTEDQVPGWFGINSVDDDTPGFTPVLSDGEEMRLYRIDW